MPGLAAVLELLFPDGAELLVEGLLLERPSGLELFGLELFGLELFGPEPLELERPGVEPASARRMDPELAGAPAFAPLDEDLALGDTALPGAVLACAALFALRDVALVDAVLLASSEAVLLAAGGAALL